MRIIGLHAKARAGKDEVAKVLCKMFGFKQVAFADCVKEMAVKYFDLSPEKVYEKKDKESRLILQSLGQAVRDNLVVLYAMFNYEGDHKEAEIDPINNLPKWVGRIAMENFELPPAFLNGRRKHAKKILQGVYSIFMDNTEKWYEIAKGSGKDFWINYLFDKCTEDITYIVSDVRYANEKKAVEEHGGFVAKITRTDKVFIEHGENHPSEVELDLDTDWFYHISNEHKSDWREHLTRQATNMIRKVDSLDFFTEEAKEKFKINIYEHE